MARRDPRDDSPPDSPLSEMDSSVGDFEEDATDAADDLPIPHPKRQKLGPGSVASSAVVPEAEPDADLDPLEGMSDVSSDTSGEVPSSPTHSHPWTRPDEDEFQEQVTVCAWEGCTAGDMGNMDRLVEHIHNDHIEGRQKKYTCEWIGCSRKSMAHASGYALKAHMRSHTREKPFYCYLPECDRAFTRSDALAKHMRTVHETEALRPSDPVPKSMQGPGTSGPAGKSSKLKIILKTPQSHAAGHDDSVDDSGTPEQTDTHDITRLSREHGFTDEELTMPSERLHNLCRLQLRWAEREGARLAQEYKQWEELYKNEWLEKEVLLDQVVHQERSWHERRQAVLTGALDVQVPPAAVVATSGSVAAKDVKEEPGAAQPETPVGERAHSGSVEA